MALVGQISIQARQSVQRASTTSGLRAAGRNAVVGQVIKHIPQAVQRLSMATVIRRIPAV
jgi:hypothetical protein